MDQQGTSLADVRDPAPAQPRLVQGRVPQPVRELLPDRARLPRRRLLRPRVGVVRDDRHLLRHPPPAVRRGRRPHAVLQWRRRGRRVAQDRRLRPDRRRAGVAGVVPDRNRHQRRRRHHPAVERAQTGAGRSTRSTLAATRGSSSGATASCPIRSTTPRSGSSPTASRAGSRTWTSATTRRRRASPRSTRCRRRSTRTFPREADRLRTARPRHRPARRRLDGAFRQQPFRIVRPLGVRGPQRARGGRRAALRRRLDALPDARTGHPRHRPADARRLPLLQLGRPARHARPRPERPDRQRLELPTPCWPSCRRPASGS